MLEWRTDLRRLFVLSPLLLLCLHKTLLGVQQLFVQNISLVLHLQHTHTADQKVLRHLIQCAVTL